MKIYHLRHDPTDGNLFFVEHPKDMFEYKSELFYFLQKKLGTELENIHDEFYDYIVGDETNGEETFDRLVSNKKQYKTEFDKWLNYKVSWARFLEMECIDITSRNLIA